MVRFLSLILAIFFLVSMSCGNAQEARQPTNWLASAISRQATYGTNKIHYSTVGDGRQTLVFVHGWACHSGIWREQVSALTNHARLILIDLPGHGQSDKPETEYTMDFFALGVLSVLRQARVERATLIGHSMGTPVICRVFAQAPNKVAGLVAIDGLLRRPKTSAEEIERFVGPYRTPDYRAHVTRFVGAMFPNPGTAALRDRTLAEILATPQHVMRSSMENMVSAIQPAWDPQNVTIPVLVLNAKNQLWTVEYEAYVRALSPQTDYRILDGTGHFLMLEKPAEFNALLVEMLGKFKLIEK